MNKINKVLNTGEKIIWQGQPQFWVFIVGGLWTVVGGLIPLAMGVFIFYLGRAAGGTIGYIFMGVAFLPIFFAILGFFGPIINIFRYKNAWFAFTDKRVIQQTPFLFKEDFDYIDYDNIGEGSVEVGISDKIFGKNSGSILVNLQNETGRGRTRNIILSHISDPYDVFELFKQTAFNVKTDINFPNALRPEENPGYQTKLTSEDVPPNSTNIKQ